MQLTPGTVGNLRIRIPVTQTENFPGELDDPEIDRMLLHQAFRLPLGRWSRVATGMMQLSVGLFNDEEVGIAQTTATTFLEGLLLFKSTLARVGSSFTDLDTWVLLTEISAAELRFTLLPDTFMQLTPGTVGNLRIRIPVTQTGNFPGELDVSCMV